MCEFILIKLIEVEIRRLLPDHLISGFSAGGLPSTQAGSAYGLGNTPKITFLTILFHFQTTSRWLRKLNLARLDYHVYH
jgi:hypothetical protein